MSASRLLVRAARTRRLISKGIDPSQHKQQQAKKAEIDARSTFKHVADEFIAAAERKGTAERTMERSRHIFKKYVIPKLGHRHIAELKASDVLAVLTDLDSRGLLETARRTRQLIGSVFKLAVLIDRAASDPTHILQTADQDSQGHELPRDRARGRLWRAAEEN
jgi:integrase